MTTCNGVKLCLQNWWLHKKSTNAAYMKLSQQKQNGTCVHRGLFLRRRLYIIPSLTNSHLVQIRSSLYLPVWWPMRKSGCSNTKTHRWREHWLIHEGYNFKYSQRPLGLRFAFNQVVRVTKMNDKTRERSGLWFSTSSGKATFELVSIIVLPHG